MALNKATLKTSLENWMNNPVASLAEAADTFADAYYNYALGAIDISGDSPLSVNKTGIVNAFLSLTTSETPSSAAIKFETGLVNFWTGGSFSLLTPPPGTIAPEISANVTTSIIPPAISTDLTTIFADNSGSTPVSEKATQMSDLFDIATKTVIVTCIGTNASPPPPTITVPGTIS